MRREVSAANALRSLGYGLAAMSLMRALTCEPLSECLRKLAAWQARNARQGPITLWLQLDNWRDGHGITELDGLLRGELGKLLYEPRELIKRCPSARALPADVSIFGWPIFSELESRIFVVI